MVRYAWSKDLVLYLSFDEGLGNKAVDQSIYNNNGTIYGATWTDGIVWKALSFDGVDDYVKVPVSDLFRFESLTISLWAYPTEKAYNIAHRHLIRKGWYGGEPGFIIVYYKYQDEALDIHLKNDDLVDARIITPKGSFKVNQWNHVVVTWDGSLVKAYINKEFVGSASLNGTITTTYDLYINDNYRFKGIIDEVRVYNRALSEDEIKQLYEESKKKYIRVNTRPVLREKGLVLELPFNEGSGNKVYDNSGFKNDGTIYGAKWVKGINGYALEFDGVDDYVEVPDSGSLDITDEITMIAWFKAVEYPSNRQYIVVKESSYRFFINYDGKIYFQLNLDGNWAKNWVVSNTAIELNKWIMIATTYSASTEQAIIYLNGKMDASGDLAGVYITPSDYPLWIAHEIETGTYFKGIIDEVRVYNRALSEEEIKKLYYRHKLQKPHTYLI